MKKGKEIKEHKIKKIKNKNLRKKYAGPYPDWSVIFINLRFKPIFQKVFFGQIRFEVSIELECFLQLFLLRKNGFEVGDKMN